MGLLICLIFPSVLFTTQTNGDVSSIPFPPSFALALFGEVDPLTKGCNSNDDMLTLCKSGFLTKRQLHAQLRADSALSSTEHLAHPAMPPSDLNFKIQDEGRLAELGYTQELGREWSLLHNFGASFSIIVGQHHPSNVQRYRR